MMAATERLAAFRAECCRLMADRFIDYSAPCGAGHFHQPRRVLYYYCLLPTAPSNRLTGLETVNEALPFEAERRAMVEHQLRRRGIRDERVLQAMFEVPRHEFVPVASLEAAYEDRPLSIGESETISQPYIVATMTQAGEVQPGEKALEIGTGSGYQAAILADLGANVYTLERNFRLAESARARLARLGYQGIEVIWGDGSEGYAAAAPYDVILVTAGAPRVPEALKDQLAEGGRMLIPVGDLRHQDLRLMTRRGSEFVTRMLDPCQFVPLIGAHGWLKDEG
jgi:protein-L-isoaspartate(D-aspartate) O-methyltransferase